MPVFQSFQSIKTTFKILRHFQRFTSTNPTAFVTDDNNLNRQIYGDFRKYLKTNEIPHKDGYTCLHLQCQLCTCNQNITAYINKRTGQFICPGCEIKKSLEAVVSLYEKRKCIDDKEILKGIYKTKHPQLVEPTQIICDSLNIRGIKVEDVRSIGGQYNPLTHSLHFPLKNALGKEVGEKVLFLNDKTEQTFQNSNCSGVLMHGPINKNKAILVTNLIDFLVLSIQRIDTHCIVCLPYHLTVLPQECLPALEKYKEIVFWFNFDSTGWDSARTFSKKLDEKRCLLIRPTDTEPTPFDANRKRLNLKHILQRATPVQHKSITTFSSLRKDILSELQNIEKVNGVKWKRFPVLNKLLKGHRKGELTIMTGPTGSGKTTFMSEYSLDLALQGVSTLWGSFEIRNSRLAATLLRQYVGYPLDNKLNEFEHWANEFEQYPLYFMTFHGQQPLKIVMEAIEHAQYIYDINHVIIDNLQFMMGVSSNYRSDKFWEQDAIIASFRAFATKHNVHVTLVMHPRKEREEDDLTTSSVFGTAKATQEADNVLIIQDKRLTSLRGKKYLQIAKNRYSGDLGIMPLNFDKDSLSYSTINQKKKEKDREKDMEVEKDKTDNVKSPIAV